MHPSINKDYLGSYSIMSSHASSYAPTPNASAEALDPRATLLKATQALGMHESTAEQRFATRGI